MSKKKKEGKPPPKCKAILLCETAILDAQTGKVSVIHIFEGFNFSRFPAITKRVDAYLQLTSGIGKYLMTVEVHDLADNSVLARATVAEMNFRDRIGRQNLIIPIPPLPIAHAGVYDVVVFADGKEIDRQ